MNKLMQNYSIISKSTSLFLKICKNLIKIANFKCQESWCDFTSDNKKDFIYVLDTENPGMYCKNHAGFCEICHHPAAKHEAEQLLIATDDDNYYDRLLCQTCTNKIRYKCQLCNKITKNIQNFSHNRIKYNICQNCFDKNFFKCPNCYDLTLDEEDDEYYCSDCHNKLLEERNKFPEKLEPYTSLQEFSVYDNDKALSQLKKVLPITVKDLKTKYPSLFNSLKDLVIFTKGQDLTLEKVLKYENTLPKQNFEIEYTTWNSKLQRSVKSDTAQLVLNFKLTNADIVSLQNKNMKAYGLFDTINSASKGSGHPYVKDQLGWARLELNPEEKYILVDEIQTDHMNALDRIKKRKYEGKKYIEHLKNRWQINDEEMDKIINIIKEYVKNFPDIAVKGITEFAKQNGFTKIYWHTYESGSKLKENTPPKSLYTEIPKNMDLNHLKKLHLICLVNFLLGRQGLNYISKL